METARKRTNATLPTRSKGEVKVTLEFVGTSLNEDPVLEVTTVNSCMNFRDRGNHRHQ